LVDYSQGDLFPESGWHEALHYDGCADIARTHQVLSWGGTPNKLKIITALPRAIIVVRLQFTVQGAPAGASTPAWAVCRLVWFNSSGFEDIAFQYSLSFVEQIFQGWDSVIKLSQGWVCGPIDTWDKLTPWINADAVPPARGAYLLQSYSGTHHRFADRDH
jgi:hypothetical protein